MIARIFIAVSLIALSTAPALASGRGIDKTDTPSLIKEQGENPPVAEGVPHSYGSGSRVKPSDRPVLTKSGVTYDLYLQTDRGLSFYGTFDRNGAAATADRLRLNDETVVCRASN